MQVIILGSGPVKPIPRPHCFCSTCKDARLKRSLLSRASAKESKSRRTRSSALVQVENKNILIDASPDFLKQIKRERIKIINAVLITHPHFDAIEGIKFLNRWAKIKIPVYLEKASLKIVKKENKKINKLDFKIIKPYKAIKINSLKILPLKVTHYVLNEKKFPTLAFKIKNLIYASDVIQVPRKSLKYFKNIPYLILDAAMYFKTKFINHLNTEEAIKFGKKLNVKNLYLTQIGHYYPPYKEAAKEIKNYLKKNKIKIKVLLTFDGMKIKI